MRLLVNHSEEDRPHLPALIPLMKQFGLSGVSSNRTYDITTLQQQATKAGADAILLSNPETLVKLLGEKATLDKYRGTRINYSIPIIVINPLEHVHTVNHGKWLLEKDLSKFKRIKEKPQVFDFILCETEETMREAFHFLKVCIINSFDIETDERRQITCISFTGLHPSRKVLTFVVPFIDFGVIHYRDLEDLAEAIEFMQKVLALPNCKAAFNGTYDSQYCITYNAQPNNYTLDAMILTWAEYSELPRALEFQASIHCYDYFFWKDEADTAKEKKDIRSYWAYCGKDSWYTLRVLLSSMSKLQAYQLFNYQETFKLIYPALYCAFEGFKVDQLKLAEIRAEHIKSIEEKKKKLQIISCNPDFNPASYVQVSHLIYEVIGGKKPEKFKGAGTSNPVLNRVATQHPLLATICDLITSVRKDLKAVSNYCDFDQLFGRLLYSIDVSGAETGRAASQASAFWVGTQIQNVPPYAKPMLIADDGFDLVEADKNKSEARCVAYMAKSETMITALEDKVKDFYKVCATIFFGIPYEQVTSEYRNDITKHIIHGTHHLMGPDPFIDRVTPKKMYTAMILTKSPLRNMESFAKYLLSLYHKMNPELKSQMWPAVKSDVASTHLSVSHLGWTRYFFGNPIKQHKVLREAVAHQSQNLSVHLLNRGMWRIYVQLVLPSNGDFRLKAQIHDSILAQIRKEKTLEYAEKMKEIMDIPVDIFGRTLRIPTDFKTGTTWGKMTELKLS